MTHSTQTTAGAPANRRMAGAFAVLVTAAMLAGCALAPGRPYDFSQVHPGQTDTFAHANDTNYHANAYGNYGYNNFPR
jgi:hypothetical protein